MTDTLELGGKIGLRGFSDLDPGQMIVVKKIVGNYARRFSEIVPEFERLELYMKPVHKQEGSQKFEISAKLQSTRGQHVADVTDPNLFFAMDKVLKKVENSIEK